MKNEIPAWVIEYNNAGHLSSAGRAVKITLSKVDALEKELASLKEENARLKESIKELLPIVEFFTISHLKDGEIWMNRDEVINRAKSLLR